MQRDFDLVVTILGALRDSDAATLSARDIQAAVHAATSGNESIEQVAHHLDILGDAGLAKQTAGVDGRLDIAQWRITWKGYDALEQENNEDDDEDD